MLVRNWMTPTVTTVDAKDAMQDAISLLKETGRTLFPVLSKGKLVGILSDGDLKTASPSKATTLDIHELVYLTSRILVEDIMTPAPICVGPDFTIEEAAEILLEKKIAGLPVTDDAGGLVGIITKSDIFRVLLSLSGQGKRGFQVAVRLPDEPGAIKAVRDAIHACGAKTASILSSAEEEDSPSRNVYFRIYAMKRDCLEPVLAAIRRVGTLLYVVDHRDGSRKIFSDAIET